MRRHAQIQRARSIDQKAERARMTNVNEISDDRTDANRAKAFLLAAFAVGQALQVNNGNLHPVGLLWIAAAIGAVVMGLRIAHAPKWLQKIPLNAIAGVCLAIQWADVMAWGIGFRRVPGIPPTWFIVGMIMAGVGLTTIFAPRARTLAMVLLIAGHTLAGADVICRTKAPFIDVFYFQQESTAALLHGHNPYGVRYRNIYGTDTDYYSAEICDGDYLNVSHPYPPLTLLMALPARLVGDVRWAHLVALELAGILIALSAPRLAVALARRDAGQARRLNENETIALWSAAMLLLCPRALMIVYFAWTEAMVVLCLAAVIFCAARAPKQMWIAMGLCLASKQYMILVAPLALLFMSKKDFAKSLLLAAAITLPFVVWNPAAFLRSVVLMQMKQPFRFDALSFPAILARFTAFEIPSITAFIAAGAALIWTSRVATRSVAGFTGASALVLIVFFALNKQAFCNYYFLTAAVSCCAACASIQPREILASNFDPVNLKLAA
jgi:hypothetical protein